jgi:hypothetical protein
MIKMARQRTSNPAKRGIDNAEFVFLLSYILE